MAVDRQLLDEFFRDIPLNRPSKGSRFYGVKYAAISRFLASFCQVDGIAANTNWATWESFGLVADPMYKPLRFNLRGFLLFCSAAPPIAWLITVFEIDYRLMEPVLFTGKIESAELFGLALRAIFLGIALGIAVLTAGVGWRLMKR
jgi:hypothetical protein